MHSTVRGQTTFHHDGDFGGNTIIVRNGQEMEVPFEDIKAYVVEYIRRRKQNRLFELNDDQMLGL